MPLQWIVLALMLVILFTASPNSLAAIYKWVDDQGQVQFGDQKFAQKNMVNKTGERVDLNTKTSDWSKFDINIHHDDVELTQQEIQYIIDGVNSVYEFYDRVLYFDIYKTVPVNIRLLKDKASYAAYLRQQSPLSNTASYGVYFPKDNRIAVYMRNDREGTFATIRHEVSHAIVDTILPYAPAWLNEGLAEQMETLRHNESGLYLEPHRSNRVRVMRAKRSKDWLDIEDYLKLPSQKWRHTLNSNNYSLQSVAGEFVRFLLSTQPNRNFLTRLIHKFERGNRTLSFFLIDEAYTGGVNSMELAWNSWLRREDLKDIELY